MIKELNENNFKNETKNGLKIIEFHTTWCGYCKKQESELNALDKIWIGQIDADKEPKLSAQYNITSYPTFIIMKDGKEVERFSGYYKKEDLLNKIIKHMDY